LDKDAESVRSSVARQLGLEQAGLPEPARHEASVVQRLVSAVRDLGKPLTCRLLCNWQTALFPEPPSAKNVNEELQAFLTFYNNVLPEHHGIVRAAMEHGLLRIDRVLLKATCWKTHAQTVLSQRQVKVLNWLLDGYGLEFIDGLAARHYQSIADVSKATATRDLTVLLNKGCLKPLGAGGRSVRYVINQNQS
jgi:Fic family protein